MDNSEINNTSDDIWQDDVFGIRQVEAELLAGYIESVSRRPNGREDAKSHIIAVDAPYGEGKTFFLKRFERHMSLNHPVAYIDAWRDDLADEPMTALASTLKRAFAPLFQKSPDIEKRFNNVLSKTWTVAKLVTRGVVRRGLGYVLTSSVVDEIADAFDDDDSSTAEAAKRATSKIGDDTVDAMEAVLTHKPQQLMSERIADFEEGQQAISDLKESLSELVDSLDDNNIHAPVVIIIDELDRCRPTYAIILLEEIKHLFEVPGIVFVLGMNGEQLTHSLSGVYGEKFDGAAYLKRFISRKYRQKRRN